MQNLLLKLFNSNKNLFNRKIMINYIIIAYKGNLCKFMIWY